MWRLVLSSTSSTRSVRSSPFLEDPVGALLVPDQAVARDIQLVGLCELHQGITHREVPLVLRRMDRLGLHAVLGRDVRELRVQDPQFCVVEVTRQRAANGGPTSKRLAKASLRVGMA